MKAGLGEPDYLARRTRQLSKDNRGLQTRVLAPYGFKLGFRA